MSLYIALIYGLLYLFLQFSCRIWTVRYTFNNGLTGLTFLSIIIGLLIALVVMPSTKKNHRKRVETKGGQAGLEDSLVGTLIRCWFVPVPLFIDIFGWTRFRAVTPRGV